MGFLLGLFIFVCAVGCFFSVVTIISEKNVWKCVVLMLLAILCYLGAYRCLVVMSTGMF